ncbi:MAG TPA: hypothetical protein VJZ68_09335 [Nitrososphaera sp.]|nr:hypothetical protein [Nitrososphaera sp.]
MTDFMFMPIWILLSWLIRQVEGGIDNEPEEGNETGSEVAGIEQGGGPIEVDPYEPVVQLIKVGIAAFSLLLLGLSISAYRKTALKGIIYAALAFGLFAAQLFFDYLEDAVEGWEQQYNDVIYYAMTLAILVLFFLAIVRRNKA